jgi:unsaturated chondroitin disaccharide hydrolase
VKKTALAVADFFIEHTPTDGVPYWDTGAPGLAQMGDYLSRPAEIDNAYEPVDSSAAAICAQGYLRLGALGLGEKYTQAGLTISRTLLTEAYLSGDPAHEGLLLHSVYHRPRGWDYIPPGKKVPQGESSMWGDYHMRELALWLRRKIKGGAYPVFFLPKRVAA